MAAEVHTIIAILGDAAPVPVKGEIMTVGFTATITTVVGRWVSGAITLAQTLPRGKYACVGAAVWEADCLAFRFIIPGAFHRPGGIGTGTIGTAQPDKFRYGGLGVWFEFDSLVQPSLELLHAAAAAQTVGGCLDLIKIG